MTFRNYLADNKAKFIVSLIGYATFAFFAWQLPLSNYAGAFAGVLIVQLSEILL